jgi:Leucine-rich repeat (LRR) protein
MITPIEWRSFYTCRLREVHVPDEDFEIDLSGTHLTEDGKVLTDDDVESVEFKAYTNTVVALPKLMFTTFKHLKNINCVYNEVERIKPGTITNCESLESLAIYGNKIQKLENDVFKGCGNLVSVDVGHNQISEVGENVFADSHKMKTLTLSRNHLSVIPEGFFKHLTNLEELDLGANMIKVVPENGLKHLTNLERIYLNGNGITDLPLCTFHPLQKIMRIVLSYNEISHIQPGTFSLLPNLYHISLSNNRINQIDAGTFPSTITDLLLAGNNIERLNTNIFDDGVRENLSYLRLEENQINAIEPTFFNEMPNLATLDLRSNLCHDGTSYPISVKEMIELLTVCFDNFDANEEL